MNKTVLIVEDERAIVEILKFNLKREGYETLEALDGRTGLELARTRDPDLILLDVMLPEMNGFDVCAALRDGGSAVPIIMLTAREEENDKVFGLEAGADDYITKPFSMRELLARVKANIRRRTMDVGVKPASVPGLRSGDLAIDPTSITHGYSTDAVCPGKGVCLESAVCACFNFACSIIDSDRFCGRNRVGGRGIGWGSGWLRLGIAATQKQECGERQRDDAFHGYCLLANV